MSSATEVPHNTLESELNDALDRLDHEVVFGEISVSEYVVEFAQIVVWFEERGLVVPRDDSV